MNIYAHICLQGCTLSTHRHPDHNPLQSNYTGRVSFFRSNVGLARLTYRHREGFGGVYSCFCVFMHMNIQVFAVCMYVSVDTECAITIRLSRIIQDKSPFFGQMLGSPDLRTVTEKDLEVCIHTYMHSHTHTHRFIWHIHTHIHTHIIHIHNHRYTYIHILQVYCVGLETAVAGRIEMAHTHTYTYTYIHIHTCTCTHFTGILCRFRNSCSWKDRNRRPL
jgi:hypothetical protein